MSGAVQEDGHELSITLTFAIRGNKDPLTGRKLGITGDYLSMHTENDSLTSYRSDSEGRRDLLRDVCILFLELNVFPREVMTLFLREMHL